MFNGKSISVIFPVYNEGKNIRRAINEFFATGIVDEIIAVDNNSTDNSKKEILKTKARYILEKKQGYGNALMRGMREAKSDYIITVEPDGTFDSKDLFKFVHYADDFDVVFGTRTSKSMIWSNAKMNFFLRLGNWAVAKMLEYLYNGPCLTDVGCTFKCFKREKFKKISSRLTVGGSHFSPELMLLCIKKGLSCVEIPVTYKERIGDSKITSNFWKSFKLGIRMIWLIFYRRFTKN
jgi:glycosyltransferase involved in cell wall biosynthesis